MPTTKEPPLSRRRKATCHSPKKQQLKFVCCFNGAFHPRPPSGKLRYVGGEARIVSVDRTVVFSKLQSKISDLFPNINNSSFSLKYKLPGSGSDSLTLVASDDDVRCMVDEHDRLELLGKSARLWLFVCTNDNGNNSNNNRNTISGSFVNCVKGAKLSSSGFESEGKNDKVAVKNLRHDESLLKMVLKQQLLANKSGLGRGFGANETSSDAKFGCFGEKNQLRVDLREDRRLGGSTCGDNLGQFSETRANPLNPRDGNSRVEKSCYRQCCCGRSGGVLCNNGVGMSCQAVMATPCSNSTPMNGSCNGFCGEGKKGLGNDGMAGISDVNRENIRPWEASCYSVKTRVSCDFNGDGLDGDKVWGVSKSSIRNHRFGGNDSRNHWCCYQYHVRNHQSRSNVADFGSHRAKHGISVRKCYPGTRPNLNIVKGGGQPMRAHHPNSWRHCYGLSEQALMEQRVRMMDANSLKDSYLIDVLYGNEKLSKQGGTPLSLHRNCDTKESTLGCYGAFTGVSNQSLLKKCDANENSSSSGRKMDILEELLIGSDYRKCEGPYRTQRENFCEVPGNCEPIRCELEKETCQDSQKVANTSGLSSEVGCSIGIRLGDDNKLPNGEAIINSVNNCQNGTNDKRGSYSGVTSSLSSVLLNLSLPSSKELEVPQLSSHASSVVSSDVLLISQSKPIDLMDEGEFSPDHQVDEANGVANPCSGNSAKNEKNAVHVEEAQQDPPSSISINRKANNRESLKCSKVIGGTSSDLTALYTHLATPALQTIKSSDLEFTKELGSGTYGMVYYGKWKGSDVAIKKIKPSCFSEGTAKGDRLLSDFWKEAHLLGQLHHPNIVAFYGVVSDGPVKNLATVTEYMVNGSLKQVLRRKDRTIDRRKRLIIAMDAAFGMEYLHEKRIVHFDLKSHNFLVNVRDPQRPVCKIGDLGLSKIKQRTLVSGGVRGTIPWMAPELLNSKNNLVTEKVDVYSFGIVMWELLTGEEPYENMRTQEIIGGIIKGNLRPEIPSWCDPIWRSLMERCWSSDPDSRPPFSEISKELRAMSAAMNIK